MVGGQKPVTNITGSRLLLLLITNSFFRLGFICSCNEISERLNWILSKLCSGKITSSVKSLPETLWTKLLAPDNDIGPKNLSP